MITTTWINIIKPAAAPEFVKYVPEAKSRKARIKTELTPFLKSRRELIEVIRANPFIKPKAACRILGWSSSKMEGVMKYCKDDIGNGLNLKG
jgi:hypothetical protein